MASLAALLLGSHDVVLLDGVLRIPDPLVSPLAGGIVITSWLDGCIALWPRAVWESLADRLLALPISNAGSRAFGRLLFSSAVEIAIGRLELVVPDALRRAAGIDDRAILVGGGDHAELWAPDRWRRAADRSLDDLRLPVAV